MAYITQTNGYVKFLRGTQAAWDSLQNKDNDTLYFISEKDSTTGKLYLGNKLIDGGEKCSISDLPEILIDENISDGSLLVYDILQDKWVNKTVSEVVTAAVANTMVGATETTDSIEGLVPVAVKGQQNLYLKGDATWANPTAEVEAQLVTIVGNDANKSIRDIASEEVSKIVNGAPEAFDTLKEISVWIQDHSSTAEMVSITNSIKQLEDSLNGTEEKIEGDTTIPATEGLITKVTNIENQLRWYEFTEES